MLCMGISGWLKVVMEVAEEEAGEEGEEAGGYVVEHDAGAGGEGFEAADGPGLPMSKRRKRRRSSAAWASQVWRDEGEELAGYFVDDYEAWVFAGGLAGRDGGGGDACTRDEECGYDCGDGESEAAGGEEARGCEPEEDGEGAGVGAGAGL